MNCRSQCRVLAESPPSRLMPSAAGSGVTVETRPFVQRAEGEARRKGKLTRDCGASCQGANAEREVCVTGQSESDSPTITLAWWVSGNQSSAGRLCRYNCKKQVQKRNEAGRTESAGSWQPLTIHQQSSRVVQSRSPLFSRMVRALFPPDKREMMGFHPSCLETELDSEGGGRGGPSEGERGGEGDESVSVRCPISRAHRAPGPSAVGE